MQAEKSKKIHFQDKEPKKEKVEIPFLCDNCGESITARDFNKDGLCLDCRRELGIK